MSEWIKRHKRRKKMSRSIISASMLCILVSVVIAVCAIAYFTFHLVLQEKGESRVDVLQQISDSNSVNRTNMVNVMNMVYEDFYSILTAAPDEQVNGQIEQALQDTDAQLRHTGMDFIFDIVMNDHRTFTTSADKSGIEGLQSTYWYIRHYSGETDTSWNLRFWDVNDLSSYGLSYGRTVYDPEGKPVGVIVITAEHEALFRTFQKLVSDGAKVYILDQNGIIICHTNAQRVGNWMTSMEAFQEEYGYNSYRIIQRGDENVILASYYDKDSGWTFVEEQNIDALLWEGFALIRNCLMVVLVGCLIAGILTYLRVKKVTDELVDVTDAIGDMQPERLRPLPVSEIYEETYVLSTTFNGMIDRIRSLIEDIRLREQEKQRTEYDFLQAQINPHFLNNTLLAAKGLIAMGRVDRAGRMLTELVELLHIPSTPEIQFVPLEEELHLVRNYIAIMNCRTEKGVAFYCDIPDKMLSIPVPRMILQPLVGNSFFHGFAERDEGCEIRMSAGFRGSAMYIDVTDNGEGIPERRLTEVRSGNYRSGKTHHGIGLKNVQKRLRIIYGGMSGVKVRSKLGAYTTVTVTMDHYRELKIHCKTAVDAAKEAANEDHGG